MNYKWTIVSLNNRVFFINVKIKRKYIQCSTFLSSFLFTDFTGDDLASILTMFRACWSSLPSLWRQTISKPTKSTCVQTAKTETQNKADFITLLCCKCYAVRAYLADTTVYPLFKKKNRPNMKSKLGIPNMHCKTGRTKNLGLIS